MRYSASSWSWPAVQAARKSNRLLCAMRLVNKGLAAASNAARTLHHPTLQPSAHLRFPAKLTSVIAVTLHRPPVENPLPEVDLTPPGKNFPHLAPVQSISIVRIVDVLLPWKVSPTRIDLQACRLDSETNVLNLESKSSMSEYIFGQNTKGVFSPYLVAF